MLYNRVEKLHHRLSRSVVLVRVAVCMTISEAHQQKGSQESQPPERANGRLTPSQTLGETPGCRC